MSSVKRYQQALLQTQRIHEVIIFIENPWNPGIWVLQKNAEKMSILAKCWQKQKGKKLFKTVFVYFL